MTDLEKLKLVAERVDYDPETGVFTWKNDSTMGHKTKGKCASVRGSGGMKVRITSNGVRFSISCRKLAWFMVTGNVPEGDVTTKYGDPFNHSFANLQIGVLPHRKSKRYLNKNGSGTGVSFNKGRGIYECRVMKEGFTHYARFDNQLDAEVWVIDKRNELGFDGNLHGRVEE